MSDIEDELRHYKHHFENKIVFCNCDDPFESNFFKYFAINFNHLNLKKLICTCYAGSPVSYSEFNDLPLFRKEEKLPYKIEITEVPDLNGDGATDLSDIELLLKSNNNSLTILDGDGDFRSEESIEFLKEADIVVTNPPFSLLKEYFAQLMEYGKKFVIISAPNNLHYKEIFPYIRDNKVWLGYKSMSKDMLFDVSKEFEAILRKTKKEGSGWRIVGGKFKGRAPAIWLTNLDIDKRHEKMILYKKYSPEGYLHYENLDAIDVGKVSEIPEDYDGLMGVPDSFLEYYNPDQFELIGLGAGDLAKEIGVTKNYRGRTDIYYIKDGKPGCPYSRIIIRRKHED